MYNSEPKHTFALSDVRMHVNVVEGVMGSRVLRWEKNDDVLVESDTRWTRPGHPFWGNQSNQSINSKWIACNRYISNTGGHPCIYTIQILALQVGSYTIVKLFVRILLSPKHYWLHESARFVLPLSCGQGVGKKWIQGTVSQWATVPENGYIDEYVWVPCDLVV